MRTFPLLGETVALNKFKSTIFKSQEHRTERKF